MGGRVVEAGARARRAESASQRRIRSGGVRGAMCSRTTSINPDTIHRFVSSPCTSEDPQWMAGVASDGLGCEATGWVEQANRSTGRGPEAR